MKKVKHLTAAILIFILVITCIPVTSAKADSSADAKAKNAKSVLMYVGQSWFYQFIRIGTIQKVTLSNKKVISYTVEDDTLYLDAKSAGTTKITVKGTRYTYTINLTVKKMDIAAKFVKQLPDGKYLMKITNNTKEGFFEGITFSIALRSSSGEFLDWDKEYKVWELTPGATIYAEYEPYNVDNIDLTKSTIEVNSFTTDMLSDYTYTDCASKIKAVDAKGGKINSSDTDITIKLKNNAAYEVNASAQIYWYNKDGKIVKIDDIYASGLGSKKVESKTVSVPAAEYGAVSYGISVRAYRKSL